jgi:hypothetical protein
MAIYQRGFPTAIVLAGFIAGLLSLITAACVPEARPTEPTKASTPTSAAAEPAQPVTPTIALPTDLWLAVLQKRPYPYATPLPPPTSTALDGIYVKDEPKEGTPVPCRRCPDYLPEGGIWRLSLDRGAYRIFHEVTGWYSLGSFTVAADRLLLFNDPTCIDAVGFYRWEMEEGELHLAVVEDACQVDRRSRSFANLAWAACRPPNAEAAVTDHWPRPADCVTGE